jgi:tetratricopeptide (TPR) repeat protein
LAAGENHELLHVHRGRVLYSSNRYQEALAAVAHALALDPDFGPAFEVRGMTRFQLGDFEGEASDFSTQIALGYDTEMGYPNRAEALVKLGRCDEALRDCDRGDQDDGFCQYTRGLALEGLGKRKQARAAFARAAGLGSTDAAKRLDDDKT